MSVGGGAAGANGNRNKRDFCRKPAFLALFSQMRRI
jgi:hypothetical protein